MSKVQRAAVMAGEIARLITNLRGPRKNYWSHPDPGIRRDNVFIRSSFHRRFIEHPLNTRHCSRPKNAVRTVKRLCLPGAHSPVEGGRRMIIPYNKAC